MFPGRKDDGVVLRGSAGSPVVDTALRPLSLDGRRKNPFKHSHRWEVYSVTSKSVSSVTSNLKETLTSEMCLIR